LGQDALRRLQRSQMPLTPEVMDAVMQLAMRAGDALRKNPYRLHGQTPAAFAQYRREWESTRDLARAMLTLTDTAVLQRLREQLEASIASLNSRYLDPIEDVDESRRRLVEIELLEFLRRAGG
jgi:hypothetical protein